VRRPHANSLGGSAFSARTYASQEWARSQGDDDRENADPQRIPRGERGSTRGRVRPRAGWVFSAQQQGGALPRYGQLMGASMISALPVVVLYMIFQRYLIGGLTAGGVKG
jgi:hypothetical protein